MKKLFCTVISVILALQLCACKPLDTLYSTFDEILNKAVINNTVIIIDEQVETYRVNQKAIGDNELAFLFAYSHLDSEQKRLYRIIYTAVEKMQTGWIELESCRDSFSYDISVAYQALSIDHPELFWMSNNYLISNKEIGKSKYVYLALSHNQDEYSCDYLISKEQCNTMKKQLEYSISKITDAVEGKSIYQSELYFHDYICNNTVYTEGSAEQLVYTAYGALVNGKAVCEGYSRAMQLLCKRIGIDCTLMIGTAQGENHMWNIINAGDGWYHLDVTWDDDIIEGHPAYTYFNLNDLELSGTHSIAPHFKSLETTENTFETLFNSVSKKCNGGIYNYFAHEKLLLSGDYEKYAAGKIILAENQGKKQLQFRFKEQSTAKLFNEDYKSCTQKIQSQLNLLADNKAPFISDILLTEDTVTFCW